MLSCDENFRRRSRLGQVLHSLDYGGAEHLAIRLAKNLLKQWEVAFYLLDNTGPLVKEVENEHLLEVLGRRPGLDLHCVKKLRKLWSANRPRAIVAHQYTPFAYSALARGLCAHPPLIYVEHGRFYPDRRRWRRVLFNKLILRKADRIVAVGEAVKRALVVYEGFSPRRIKVIYNGIDVDQFLYEEDRRQAYRKQMGSGPRDILSIHVARFDPLKDHVTALKALSILSGIPTRLILVGDGPTLMDVKAAATKLGVLDRVVFTGYRDDIPKLLAAADIFLLTSLSEGIPVTIIEAMAAGLPVVATAVGGVPELVVDSETGFLVPPQDAEALAAAVKKLVENAELRRKMGEAGRMRARQLFTERRMHEEYEAVIREVTSRG